MQMGNYALRCSASAHFYNNRYYKDNANELEVVVLSGAYLRHSNATSASVNNS
jgi:hypothetical protein